MAGDKDTNELDKMTKQTFNFARFYCTNYVYFDSDSDAIVAL